MRTCLLKISMTFAECIHIPWRKTSGNCKLMTSSKVWYLSQTLHIQQHSACRTATNINILLVQFNTYIICSLNNVTLKPTTRDFFPCCFIFYSFLPYWSTPSVLCDEMPHWKALSKTAVNMSPLPAFWLCRASTRPFVNVSTEGLLKACSFYGQQEHYMVLWLKNYNQETPHLLFFLVNVQLSADLPRNSTMCAYMLI